MLLYKTKKFQGGAHMRCLDIMNVTEILRLRTLHFTFRDIGQALGISKTTAGAILKRCQECDLTYESASAMSADAIKRLIYPDSFGPKQVKNEPNWESYYTRMRTDKRLNLAYIWQEEYRIENPDGYSYSRFCAKYNEWKDRSGKNVVLPQEREPGKELFIDWIGDKLPCVIDHRTGEALEAHFFVTTLGDSSYPFVEAFPDETQLSWNQGHIDAFNWYGGIPKILVPDNCKTAVTHSNLYDPQINHAYRDLARHYGVAVIPARVRKPRDKASVESSVGWLETWLLEWLSNKHYFSFSALNVDIQERVRELAKKNFKHRLGSRESNFIALDKPALRPLPKDPFQAFETSRCSKVPNNYHVKWDGFYYSVPHAFFNRSIYIHAYSRKIEIFDEAGNRIAVHTRRYSGRRYVTNPEHMPTNHRAIFEFNKYDGDYYRRRAFAIGKHTGSFVSFLLDNVEFEEQAYKSCMAVINFCKKYGNDRVDMACKKAIVLKSISYTTLNNILKNGQEKTPIKKSFTETPITHHENLRTGEWK